MDKKQQAERFAAWVKDKMKAREIRFVADLRRLSGLSQSALGSILEPKISQNTGKYSLPRRDSVIALARRLCRVEWESFEAKRNVLQELGVKVYFLPDRNLLIELEKWRLVL